MIIYFNLMIIYLKDLGTIRAIISMKEIYLEFFKGSYSY